MDSVQAGQKPLIPRGWNVQQVSGRRPIYHQVKVARGHLSGHPGRFSATVTLSWAPDTSWRISADGSTQWRWLGASWWSSLGFSWPQLPGETPNLELLVCQKPVCACVGRPKTSNYFVYPQVGQHWILVTELKNIPSIFQWQFWGRRSSGPASDSSNRSCKGWSRSPHELCPSFALHSWQSHCQILDISTVSLSDFF